LEIEIAILQSVLDASVHRMRVQSANFANLATKLVVMATLIEQQRNESPPIRLPTLRLWNEKLDH